MRKLGHPFNPFSMAVSHPRFVIKSVATGAALGESYFSVQDVVQNATGEEIPVREAVLAALSQGGGPRPML